VQEAGANEPFEPLPDRGPCAKGGWRLGLKEPAFGVLGRPIRDHADERGTAKVLDTRNSLFDAIVHSQDIAIPVGRDFPVPVESTREGLQRVWAMGWPFHAQRKLAGVTLRATDTDWTVGAGPEVAGTALSLLLLLTGRTSTVVDSL
jgi:uncharacterized protein (TIGR03083 family)